MGIIDTAWFKFTCPKCKAEETVVVHDKGSGWSGSSWQSIREPQSFAILSNGGGKAEPEVAQATCKKCGSAADVKSGYGGGPK